MNSEPRRHRNPLYRLDYRLIPPEGLLEQAWLALKLGFTHARFMNDALRPVSTDYHYPNLVHAETYNILDTLSRHDLVSPADRRDFLRARYGVERLIRLQHGGHTLEAQDLRRFVKWSDRMVELFRQDMRRRGVSLPHNPMMGERSVGKTAAGAPVQSNDAFRPRGKEPADNGGEGSSKGTTKKDTHSSSSSGGKWKDRIEGISKGPLLLLLLSTSAGMRA